MKIKALILFMSAMVCQSTAAATDFDALEQVLDSQQKLLSLDRRETDASDEASLCFFIKEKGETSPISCQHRLTRSKFNYNPFGLRFGKRNEAQPDDERAKQRQLLRVFLLRKQIESS